MSIVRRALKRVEDYRVPFESGVVVSEIRIDAERSFYTVRGKTGALMNNVPGEAGIPVAAGVVVGFQDGANGQRYSPLIVNRVPSKDTPLIKKRATKFKKKVQSICVLPSQRGIWIALGSDTESFVYFLDIDILEWKKIITFNGSETYDNSAMVIEDDDGIFISIQDGNYQHAVVRRYSLCGEVTNEVEVSLPTGWSQYRPMLGWDGDWWYLAYAEASDPTTVIIRGYLPDFTPTDVYTQSGAPPLAGAGPQDPPWLTSFDGPSQLAINHVLCSGDGHAWNTFLVGPILKSRYEYFDSSGEGYYHSYYYPGSPAISSLNLAFLTTFDGFRAPPTIGFYEGWSSVVSGEIIIDGDYKTGSGEWAIFTDHDTPPVVVSMTYPGSSGNSKSAIFPNGDLFCELGNIVEDDDGYLVSFEMTIRKLGDPPIIATTVPAPTPGLGSGFSVLYGKNAF